MKIFFVCVRFREQSFLPSYSDKLKRKLFEQP